MNLPEPYASAPTPRTTRRIQDMHEEVSVEGASIDHLNYTLEFAEQLERENLWLREVCRMQHEAYTSQEETDAYNTYNQLQEYLKAQNVKTNN